LFLTYLLYYTLIPRKDTLKRGLIIPYIQITSIENTHIDSNSTLLEVLFYLCWGVLGLVEI
jgi:hypothetical protein